MDKKIILGKNTEGAKERPVDFSYRDTATLHHTFIGLMERMWKALKNRDKTPFKYMDLPEIDLTNFKMKILENVETVNDNNGDITTIRFYVRNVFDDSNRKWFAFRDMTLGTFLPYDKDVKTGLYDFDSMWGWFRKIKVQDERYVDLYNEAQALTWYFDGCVRKFLYNNIHAD